MGVKETIIELWKTDFFNNYRSVSQINQRMLKDYGVTCSNTSVILKNCKDFLRKGKVGWIQKRGHSTKEHKMNSKKGADLEILLDNKNLWSACKSSFENGDYWDACLHAFRHLETKIRNKCELSADEHGVDLVNKAFNSNQGILKIPSCATHSEEEGFHSINRGIVLFHRNAKGHREGSIERKDAIKIICYVDYILNILNTAQKRNNS